MNENSAYNDNPLISIIVPVFNRKEFVKEAIQSALDQSYPNIEVIVVDDASNDGTFEVLKSFQPSIVIKKHKQNKGAAAARNTGIRASKGDYIFFLDSDDALEPDGIEILWSAFQPLAQKSESWGVCYGKRLTCDSNLNPVKTTPKKYYSGEILPYLLVDNIVRTGTYLVKRSILDEVGAFWEKLFDNDDLLLCYCIAAKYKFYFIDRYISKFRRHPGTRVRNNYLKILKQGTSHLDYFFNNYPKQDTKTIKEAYANKHLQLAKMAWRISMPEQYLFHWKKICFYKKPYLIHPKYALRALISTIKHTCRT